MMPRLDSMWEGFLRGNAYEKKMWRKPGKAGRAIRPWCKSHRVKKEEERKVGLMWTRLLIGLRESWQGHLGILQPSQLSGEPCVSQEWGCHGVPATCSHWLGAASQGAAESVALVQLSNGWQAQELGPWASILAFSWLPQMP